MFLASKWSWSFATHNGNHSNDGDQSQRTFQDASGFSKDAIFHLGLQLLLHTIFFFTNPMFPRPKTLIFVKFIIIALCGNAQIYYLWGPAWQKFEKSWMLIFYKKMNKSTVLQNECIFLFLVLTPHIFLFVHQIQIQRTQVVDYCVLKCWLHLGILPHGESVGS